MPPLPHEAHAEAVVESTEAEHEEDDEAKLAHEMMSLPYAFVISDNTLPDCPIVSASDEFYRMTGYSPEEVIGHNCRFLQGTDTDANEIAKLRAAIHEGKAHTCRLLNYRKNGEKFWNLLSISPVYKDPYADNEGVQPVKYIGVQLDVTEQYASTEADAVKESEASTREINVFNHQTRLADQMEYTADSLRSATAGGATGRRKALDLATTLERLNYSFVVSDPSLPDCPIVFCSDSFLKLTGYSRAEILGRNCRFLQGAETDRSEVDKIRHAVQRKEPVRVTLLNYRKNGEKFWNFVSISPIKHSTTGISGTAAMEKNNMLFIGVQLDASTRSASGEIRPPTASEVAAGAEKLRAYRSKIGKAVKNVQFGRGDVAASIKPMQPHFRGTLEMCHAIRNGARKGTTLGGMQAMCQDAQSEIVNSYTSLCNASGKNLRLDVLEPVRRLGSGDVGVVWLAQLKGSPSAESAKPLYAVKSVKLSEMRRRNKLDRLRTEEKILRMTDHPFIVQFFGTIRTEKYVHFVCEHCSGGGLFAISRVLSGRRFREHQVRFISAEVVLALQYLHSLGVIYRDIKPENILVGNDGHIRLADFDLSFVADEANSSNSSPTRGNSSSNEGSNRRSASPKSVGITAASTPRLSDGGEGSVREQSAFPVVYVTKPISVERWASLHGVNVASAGGPACSCIGGGSGGASAEGSFTEAEFWQGRTQREAPAPVGLTLEPSARTNSFVGTEEYLAPEVILGKSHGAGVDWWGLGILIYELMFGFTPFVGRVRDMTFNNILNKPLRFPNMPRESLSPPSDRESPRRVPNRGISLDAMQIISKLLVQKEADRLGVTGAEKVKSEPFFSSVNWALIRTETSPMLEYARRGNIRPAKDVQKELEMIMNEFADF